MEKNNTEYKIYDETTSNTLDFIVTAMKDKILNTFIKKIRDFVSDYIIPAVRHLNIIDSANANVTDKFHTDFENIKSRLSDTVNAYKLLIDTGPINFSQLDFLKMIP